MISMHTDTQTEESKQLGDVETWGSNSGDTVESLFERLDHDFPS
jgi:hypothetical protein